MAADKGKMLAGIQSNITNIAAALDQLNARTGLIATWFAEGYQAGGANAITDADCVPYGFTAAQIQAAVFLSQQLDLLISGGTPTTGNFTLTLEEIRSDI
jgi:hypothetical protein